MFRSIWIKLNPDLENQMPQCQLRAAETVKHGLATGAQHSAKSGQSANTFKADKRMTKCLCSTFRCQLHQPLNLLVHTTAVTEVSIGSLSGSKVCMFGHLPCENVLCSKRCLIRLNMRSATIRSRLLRENAADGWLSQQSLDSKDN
jgi:hypothetical protein